MEPGKQEEKMKPIVYQVDLVDRAKKIFDVIYEDMPLINIQEWLRDYELKYANNEKGEQNAG
jgi:hypothetical protein